MNILMWLLVLVISIAVLVKASDFFVGAAQNVGAFCKLPDFIVGVILVGVGTSLPELISSIVAVSKGNSEIVIGNVLGSNITNILLILGLAPLLVKAFKIKHNLLAMDLPMLLASSLLIALFIWDRQVSITEIALCMVCLLLYLAKALQQKESETSGNGKIGIVKEVLILLVSPVFIFLGAKFTIESVVSISKIFSLGTEILALSAVALGTSLPEVSVSVSAAKRGNAEIVVGNIIGSNIFNTFGVMGFSAMFGSLVIPDNVITFALPVSVMATLMCVFITLDGKINKWEGMLLLVFYSYFILSLYGIA